MKKVGLKAIAASLALLMTASLSAPAAAEAADKLLVTSAGGNVLVITQDMVDSEGEFVLSGEDFDKVVLPADVEIKNLYVDGCEIGEFTVEGGNNPKVQLWDAQIKNVTVSAPSLVDENKAIAEYLDLYKGKESAEDFDVDGFFKNVRETNERLNSLVPEIRLMGADMESSEQAIGAVTLAGNAKVNFTKGKTPDAVNVAFNSAQMKMDVTIEGYKGDINVDQTTGKENAFGILNIKTKKSEIGNVNVKAQGNANIALRSSDSKAATVNFDSKGDASAVLTVAAPTDNLKVAGSASNATVKVLTSLISADIQGKSITMDLGPAASVETATIAGSGNVVSGSGDLVDCTIAEGSSAAVQIPGAAVAGDNSYQPIISAPSVGGGSNRPSVDEDLEEEGPTLVPVTVKVESAEGLSLSVMTNQEEEVTVDGNTANIKPQYKTAYWSLPTTVDGEVIPPITSVKVKFSSDKQIGFKVTDAEGTDLLSTAQYPNYQVTTMTEATLNYDIASGTAANLEFMSLDEEVNVVLLAVEFTYMVEVEEDNDDDDIVETDPPSEFYLAEVGSSFSGKVGDDGKYITTPIPLHGTNFADKLPDSLKADATVYEAFKTVAGARNYIEEFVFTYKFTKASGKVGEDGGSTGSWAPQIQPIIQADNSAKGYYNLCVNGGEPGVGTSEAILTIAMEDIAEDWVEFTQAYIQFMDAKPGSDIEGTYSIKVVLKETPSNPPAEKVTDFYLAEEGSPFSGKVGDDGKCITTPIPLHGTNFADKLPDSLKADATVYEAFKTVAGARNYIEEFVFTYKFTKASGKVGDDGGSTGSWAPQIQPIIQADNSAKGYYNLCVNGGEPGVGTSEATLTIAMEDIAEDWVEFTQAYIQFMDAKPGSDIEGTYSIKVVLKSN